MRPKDASRNKQRKARRVLAFWCAFLMLVLQCFAMTAILEPSHAASPALKITVKYKDGKSASTTISLKKIKEQKPASKITVNWTEETEGVQATDEAGEPRFDEDNEPIWEVEPGKEDKTATVKALTLKRILDLAKVGTGVEYVAYSGGEIGYDDCKNVYVIWPDQSPMSSSKYTVCYATNLDLGDDEYNEVSSFTAHQNTNAVKGFMISPSSLYMTKGESQKIKVTFSRDSFHSEHGTKPSVTYKSSNTKIATVDSKGNVKAKKAGTVKITVSVKGLESRTASVTVREKPTTRKHTTYHHYRPSYRPSTRYTTRSTLPGSTTTTNPIQPSTPSNTTPITPAPAQTMTVKEVYLTPVDPAEVYGEPEETEEWNDTEDGEWDDTEDNDDSEDWEKTDNGVDFGAGAASAAVAAAACGAGAVGRIRRYHVDMKDPAEPKQSRGSKTPKEKKPKVKKPKADKPKFKGFKKK